ncbi:hypothetical protein KA005_54125, partial [bacterium]|nr:hypothetical protein [bacterium]
MRTEVDLSKVRKRKIPHPKSERTRNVRVQHAGLCHYHHLLICGPICGIVEWKGNEVSAGVLGIPPVVWLD